LRSEGRLVIAATHDDRYFHLADLVVHMEYGKVREYVTAGVAPRDTEPA
jgi:ABC-type siderophore export system fused ATPase/permease subunit